MSVVQDERKVAVRLCVSVVQGDGKFAVKVSEVEFVLGCVCQ